MNFLRVSSYENHNNYPPIMVERKGQLEVLKMNFTSQQIKAWAWWHAPAIPAVPEI
jgi:hypothetical protein